MLELDNFTDVVKQAWSTSCYGTPLQGFNKKLKFEKKALITINKDVGNLTSNVQVAMQKLHEVQNALTDNPKDSNLLSLQRRYSDNLWKTLMHEEMLLKQKSKIQWLKEGDRNSSFFHNQLKNR